ncbi:hydroxyisourate hydrolase [Phragmitibacter flavus]|uniref:5-hydroxyisourate hydrolase n=1 Tax=Phragmitibacter flavus TaxID=2576071 RepID=A0A5R8KIK7_9BACT|nr:hydroxyisourate hydrolase [Phragmitibacter flavus]TLD72156.1 hydroxyisourate hydrolase [Phragmitibacter flavus]
MLTTHVLDAAHGCPAPNLTIALYQIDGDHRTLLNTFITNTDGRTDTPLLSAEEMRIGTYELLFPLGDYFRSKDLDLPTPPFLDQVPIRFGIADPTAPYHVPLLATPWTYSTYRGS